MTCDNCLVTTVYKRSFSPFSCVYFELLKYRYSVKCVIVTILVNDCDAGTMFYKLRRLIDQSLFTIEDLS